MLGLCLLFLLPSGKYTFKKDESFQLRQNCWVVAGSEAIDDNLQ